MENCKTSTLVTLFRHGFIFVVSFFAFNFSAWPGIYTGLDWSWGAVISNSEFYNGATAWGPGLYGGYTFENVGAEVFVRYFEFKNDSDQVSTTFHVTMKSIITGLGIRISHGKYLESKMGIVMQSVSTTAEATDPSISARGLLEKNFVGAYMGGGLKANIYGNALFHLAFVYYQGDEIYASMTLEFGVSYHF